MSDPDFEAFRAYLARRTRLDLSRFKENYLRRRVESRRKAHGAESWAAYTAVLASDPDELERLKERLTVHVTEFFRDSDLWQALEREVLPGLLEQAAARPSRVLRLWSAGCSTGEEAYSLALLALRGAARQGKGVVVRVLASDLDEGVLRTAEEGSFAEGALASLPEAWRTAWFIRDGQRWNIGPALRRAVAFRRMDLFSEPPPPQVDVLLCRNVMIYFSRDTQQRLLESFHHALRGEGVFVTGKTETILGPARVRFHCISAAARIFRRV
ncbi:MAG: CheR family methyltransferase [bacterium]